MSQFKGQVTHALLTRPPLTSIVVLRRFCPWSSVRLACVKHAASVRPEPGSNSPCKISHMKQVCSCSYKSTSVSTSRTLSSSFRSFSSPLLMPYAHQQRPCVRHLHLCKRDASQAPTVQFPKTRFATSVARDSPHFRSARQRIIYYHIYFLPSTLFFRFFEKSFHFIKTPVTDC